ncbi:MAG: TonB-dependent receptor [Planctomycetes bacterium]|nr:TonB-dependent receptor [Planctomycetota bacterium]
MPKTGARTAAALAAILALAAGAGAQEGTPPAADPAAAPARGGAVEGAVGEYLAARAEGEAKEGVPAAGERKEVVVERKKRLEPVTDISVPIDWGGSRDVIDPGDVREMVPWSVEEVVNRMPGFSSRLYSGDEFARPSISARGMYDNGFTEYVAVHVDGVNYSRLIYGWTALSIFPFTSEMMYAAESFRGAHAIRFGPTTLGGVINFVTHPIPERFQVGQRTTIGDNGFHSFRFFAGGTDPESGVGVLLNYVDRGGETFRDNSDFRMNDADIKLAVPVGEDALFSFHTFHWRDVHQLIGRLTKQQMEDDREQNPTPERVKWSGWSYGWEATWLKNVARDSWYDVQYYERYGHQNQPSLRPAAPPYTTYRASIIDAVNRGLYLRGETPVEFGTKHVLHGGLRYHKEGIDRWQTDEPLAGGPKTLVADTTVDTDALSVHVDDTVKFGDWTVNGGVRYENILRSEGHDKVSGYDRDFDFDDFLFGLSVNWQFAEKAAAFANYHQSFRAPQTWSYDYTNKDQDLTFEHGDTGEIGVRADPWNGISGNAVAWKSRVSDFIEFDPVTGVYDNWGKFGMHGLDLTVELDARALDEDLQGLTLYVTNTWQRSEFEEGPYDGKSTPHTPEQFLSANLRYGHEPSGLYGLLSAYQRGETYATPDNKYDSPGYTIFNGRVGWRRVSPLSGKRNLELDCAVTAQNLFDRDYYLRHNATQYVPGSPRTLFFEFGITVDL